MGIIKLPDSEVDKAYDLLVVIISLIFAIMGSFPELFWASTPELSLEVQTMRNTVLPILTLALLWLASKLIPKNNGKILLKFVAWMTAFSLVVQLVIVYLDGTKFISFNQFAPLAEFILISSLFISPLIAHRLIFPEYKKKYPDATFFKGKIWSIASYALYLLVIGSIIFLGSTHYAAW